MAATERNTDNLQCKENLKHYNTHTETTSSPPVNGIPFIRWQHKAKKV